MRDVFELYWQGGGWVVVNTITVEVVFMGGEFDSDRRLAHDLCHQFNRAYDNGVEAGLKNARIAV